LRINSGSDDAAGLSIANGLQANIAALTQSSQNASEGVGMLQTADGALSQVVTLLNRAVTLATEASNGGLSATQATALKPNMPRSRPRSTTLARQRTSTGRRFSVQRAQYSQSDGTTAGKSISDAVAALSSTGLGLTTGGTALTSYDGRTGRTGPD
jgi:flagellin